MAQDKIYIRPMPNPSDGYVGIAWDKPSPMCETYIRKDALLEWAKFVLKCQEDELAKYDGPSYMRASTMGRIDAYKVLIAKLNSM